MHDSEAEVITYKTWPQKIAEMLGKLGVEARPKELGSDPVERSQDYYGRNFSQTPRMVTNRGCVELKNSNIDLIQIIQKG